MKMSQSDFLIVKSRMVRLLASSLSSASLDSLMTYVLFIRTPNDLCHGLGCRVGSCNIFSLYDTSYPLNDGWEYRLIA